MSEIPANETVSTESFPLPDEILEGRFLFGLSDLSRNALPEGFPQDLGFEEALFAWAERKIPADQQELFHSLFSSDALKQAFEEGHTSRSFEFDDPEDISRSRRLALHLLTDEETGNLLCVSSLKSFPRTSSEDGPEEDTGASPFRAVIRSYQLFFSVNPDQPVVRKSCVFRDVDSLAGTVSLPCSYQAFMKEISAHYVRSAWESDFLQSVSLENLKDMRNRGQFRFRLPFSSVNGPMQMEAFLPEEGNEDQQYYIGLGSISDGAGGNGLIVSAGDSEAMHATIEDLHMEMQMERDETRKKHRRSSFLLVLFTALVCILGGAVLEQKIPAFSSMMSRFFPVQTEEPVQEASPETAETEVVIPETVVSYVPFTNTAEFQADLLENGLPRDNESNETYETVSFSVSVAELLTPDWFDAQYAKKKYNLDGTESGIHLEFSFTGGEKITSVIPQDSFPVRITDAGDHLLTGYQLMDQPMGGSYNVKVASGEKADIYKRFEPQETPCYLILTYYLDGVPHDLYFSLRYDDPNVDYEDLKQGDKGEVVRAMNQKLASLGYLSEKVADSTKFSRDTATAVEAAREAFGMEKTDTADSAFLKTLFSK